MSLPIRIANCSGFYGDRLGAAEQMLDGPIDVLTGDWLAELTMYLLARAEARQPGTGYARTFVTQMEQVMGRCLDQGIRVVSNAGGLNPEACASALEEVAGRLGLSPRVAWITGDDLRPRLGELIGEGSLVDSATGEPCENPAELVTANAYLGCWGIVEALRTGADIVIAGRVTDAALACGPAAWHHGWSAEDWDALAGAVVAGHVIECGAQATGGNYAFFAEVDDLVCPGFPWAEIAADGSSIIGKHEGTGGAVTIGTVTSQLLYEIDSPRYLGPDVVARFDTAELMQLAPDRVSITGVKGEPPPPTLKVGINRCGGYRNDLSVAITGLDVTTKAELVEQAFWAACPHRPDEYAVAVSSLERWPVLDPATNDEATVVWRLSLQDLDRDKVGRSATDALVGIALASIPGFYLPSGPPSRPVEFGVASSALVPRHLIPQRVTMGDRSWDLAPDTCETQEVGVLSAAGPQSDHTDETDTVTAPLGTIVGARSGDKGGDANLGVFALDDWAWAWLDRYLTVERLGILLPEVASYRVERHRLPNLRALNFVIRGLLGDGVSACVRSDRQAKSLGEWLRAREVAVPRQLVHGGAT